MQIPSNVLFIIDIINSINIYLIFGIIFVLFYFIFALCTWSFLKPLKYIGSSNISIGIMFMSIKLINPIINAININKIIKDVLPTIINPLFISGIICLGSGILFIIIFYIINGILKKKEKQVEEVPAVTEKAEEVKQKEIK